MQAGLAFVRVGEDPASKVYVGRKEKPAPNSASFRTHVLPEQTSEADLLALLAKLNANHASTVFSCKRRSLKNTSGRKWCMPRCCQPKMWMGFIR